MTALPPPPRRFPSYAWDYDPQPLFDELDAVLAELDLRLPVKEEERVRWAYRRFRPTAEQLVANELVPSVNRLLSEAQRRERLVLQSAGRWELRVPPPPPRPPPPPPGRAVWVGSAPRKQADAVAMLSLLAVLVPWLLVALAGASAPARPPPRPPPLELLQRDPEVRRLLEQYQRELEAAQRRVNAPARAAAGRAPAAPRAPAARR